MEFLDVGNFKCISSSSSSSSSSLGLGLVGLGTGRQQDSASASSWVSKVRVEHSRAEGKSYGGHQRS